jgi:hypothetical protein
VAEKNGLAAVPGWSRWTCCDCGYAGVLAETPSRTLEWAEAVRLGFGKFKGRAIGEVARSLDGRRWLLWMVAAVTAEFAAVAVEAARMVLGEQRPGTSPPCRRCNSTETR